MSTSSSLHDDRARIGDSFAIGLVALLVVGIGQRLVGLVRGIGFCHLLDDAQLGQWAMVNSFFLIGVPLAVIGLPGSFGKFVEYYRIRSDLHNYVRRVVLASSVGLITVCTAVLLLPSQFTWLVFGQEHPYHLVVWCVMTFMAAAAFSFTNELVSALRQVRAVSAMQFIQSAGFAAFGIAFLAIFQNWEYLLPSYFLACLLGIIPGWWVIRSEHWDELGGAGSKPEPNVTNDVWRRILPFAASLWIMNFLTNMFQICDRYMLLHLSPGGNAVGQSLVGQYHAGYILPNLLVSIGLMLGGVLLPYLSADWERKEFIAIAKRLRLMLQSVSIGFVAISIAAMSLAPWLYQYAFGGKYGLAEEVLPISLAQATWASLFLIAETYLLCAEKGRDMAAFLMVALAVNFGLNYLLIEDFGLYGAIFATSTSNLLALLLVIWKMSHHGCWLGWRTITICLVPVVIMTGPVLSTMALVGLIFLSGRTDWIFTADERIDIDSAVIPKLQRLGIKIQTLWPA